MDDKTKGIIATLAATLLCGCPGLFGLCMGSMSAVASFVPNADIDIFGSNSPGAALGMGVGMLCGGIIFIAIPVVVGIKTLRKPEA